MRTLALIVALLSVGCGRIGFDASDNEPGQSDAQTTPLDAFVSAPVVIVSTGVVNGVSGRPTQSHLVYAAASATWWLFYINNTTDVLRSRYSHDRVHWNESTTVQLAFGLISGTNFSAATKVINGVDVVHVALAYTTTIERHDHLRGVLSSMAIAWDAQVMVGCATTVDSQAEDGPVTVIATDNLVYDFTSAYEDSNTCNNSNSTGNFDVTASSSPDNGGTWTPTWNTYLQLAFCNGQVLAHWGAALPGSRVLTVQTNGRDNTPESNLGDLWWAIGRDDVWSPQASVFPTPLATPVGANDWGAVQVTPTTAQLVVRLADGAFRMFGFQGMDWNERPPPPAQASKIGSGPFLASDGTSTYLFVIADDSASTIRMATFNGSGWSAWRDVETSSQMRGYLSGIGNVTAGFVTLLWTETRSTGFELVTKGVLL